MSRKKAREILLCLVFEKDHHKDCDCEKLHGELFENYTIEEICNSFGEKAGKPMPTGLGAVNEAYIKNTFAGIFENIAQIDELLSGSTVGWDYSRISKISVALLRIAAYEILYAPDIPAPVAINEAVYLSKRYDDPEAYVFVNGVLATIAKNHK
ncbi:MAG: transcription antitermination factor NusB [Oscillospiraceae bacterium]|nr:transcription antitermination factor NusB [Oscillospiraceae bacterium]